MNEGWAQGVEIFTMTRLLTVYDITMDIIITGRIDKERDPTWYAVSIGFIAMPVLVKTIVFQRGAEMQIAKTLAIKDAWVIRIIYGILGIVMLAFIDVYLLLFYP